MQTALTYRTNRDLFSNYYLDEHLPETEEWDEVSDEELQEAYDDIMDLWEREKSTAPKRNESQLEEKFIRPMFRKLGIPFEVEESTSRTQRRPDYGFFETEDAAREAFHRRDEGNDFYRNAVAVADAKRWGRPLDTRGSGEHERDFENPSYQIHVYLQETPARWAVLTDGQKWRLYYGPTSHRLDSYYEVDLPTILEKGDLEDFKYFYLFFRHEAFLEDAGGDSFLDDVYGESNVFAQELGEDLQDNIYEAIKVLSEGFMQYPENDLDEEDLGLIHDSSLIYLYRLIFVLYAEAEGRELLDTSNEIYEQSYSLNSLKQEVAEELDSGNPKYRDWQDNLQSRLDELFMLIDQGSRSRGIPEEDLYIPAYNGGLFRTDPDEDDSEEARFLANHDVGDAYLARVVELLTRSKNGNGGGKIFVDYSSLGVRHLGSIYEGLLEYKLNIADEPLALDDGEYVSTDESDDIVVDEGEVYLTTGSGERKATGSYYTPEYVVEYIVDNTLNPLVTDIRNDLMAQSARGDRGFAAEFAERVFDLRILDPAMGSGHFLTSAIDYLAREIIDAQEKQAAQQGVETVDEDHDINWARRKVAQRCIYGVDLNPLAVELAKVSLWLRTLAAEQPLAFLDHHLKTGNSLVGSDIEKALGQDETSSNGGQLTLQESFAHTRRQALEHVMERFQDLLSIDNETLDDIKRMEEVYSEVRDDPLYQHLLSMANVHTAEKFGLEIPDDAFEEMAEALRDDSWEEVTCEDWFRSAQDLADRHSFFHWELEFPVAFYNENGRRIAGGGFDAVIGNPPWMVFQKIDAVDRDFQRAHFESATAKYDLYTVFIEKGLELLSSDGEFGFIVQNKFLSANYGQYVKEVMTSEANVNQILDFEDAGIFAGTTTYPLILLLTKSEQDSFDYLHLPNASVEQIKRLLTDGEIGFNTIDSDRLKPKQAWIFPSQEQQEVIDSLRSQEDAVTDEVFEISKSVSTNLKEAFLFSEEKDSIDIEDELLQSVVDGEDIHRYASPDAGKYLLFPYLRNSTGKLELVDIDQYPKAKSHLLEYEDGLRNRRYYNKSIEEAGLEWYEYPHVKQNHNQPKVLFPDISTTPEYTFDAEGRTITTTTAYAAVPEIDVDPRYLTALLNSSVLRFVFELITPYLSGGYYRYQPQYIHQLPIIIPESRDTAEQAQSIQDVLAQDADLTESQNGVRYTQLIECAEVQRESVDRRRSLNLNLLDYLGDFSEGTKLADVGLFQPTEPGILNNTSKEYDNLRIGSVKTRRDGYDVTIFATGRYKPEDEDEYETDRWGYTETDYFEAFRLADLTEEEASLIDAFVPVATENEIAGYHENATKNNSLIDRLKSIRIPDPDDVSDDFRRYTEVRERAEDLDEKIEKTDQLIDEIVYDLYDLTPDEIEIIESAVQND
ncbi:Eco57I restriction-modification methylase domain-containing protein (plasmid) [Haloferax prahovense]|uniref:Eco57I restriction-modification methylase domain-containing protein n=1 Tax=Haloferax prahovense TaxID=381852 RepID=UPI003C74F3BD